MRKDFYIRAAAAAFISLAPMVAGSLEAQRTVIERAQACRFAPDPIDPRWEDGTAMSAEDCRYMDFDQPAAAGGWER